MGAPNASRGAATAQGSLLSTTRSAGVHLTVVSSKPVELLHCERHIESGAGSAPSASSSSKRRRSDDGDDVEARGVEEEEEEEESSAEQQQRRQFWGAPHLAECAAACAAALDCELRTDGGGGSTAVCGSRSPRPSHRGMDRLVVFNLFALEGA